MTKTKEPQYIISVLNTPMLNYNVYIPDKNEKLKIFLTGFFVGGLVGLCFYSGFFKNEDGIATSATHICNLVIFILFGFIGYAVFRPIRIAGLYEKRRSELLRQFRAFLNALSVALSSGFNVTDSLQSALDDLKNEFEKDAFILLEVNEMKNSILYNISIEDAMYSFAKRSGLEDIRNFAEVFAVCNRTGGNLKDVVRRTGTIISEKIDISCEIEMAIYSNKMQFTAMMVIPVVMMVLLRLMSSNFAKSFTTAAGVAAITVSIGMFALAYKLGMKIMDIEKKE